MTTRRASARVKKAGDRGASTIEVLGLVPVVIALALCLIQVCFFAYAVLGTNQAVRDGARAVSLGRSAAVAVEQSLPGNLDSSSVTTGASGRVAVRVPVPRVKPFPQFVVERDATMPRTDS